LHVFSDLPAEQSSFNIFVLSKLFNSFQGWVLLMSSCFIFGGKRKLWGEALLLGFEYLTSSYSRL
jgi:hypothetical protein